MSFQSNAARTSAPAAPANEAWKAQGFLNFYLPSKEAGKRRKLGAIAMRGAKPAEKTLADWLQADPANLKSLIAKLEIEYQSAEASEANGFDLG